MMKDGQGYTYVMIKPFSKNDAENAMAQFIIMKELEKRFAEKDLEIMYKQRVFYGKKDIEKHYQEHVGKSFYEDLENCLLKNNAVGMMVADKNRSLDVIKTVRSMAGSTIKLDKQTGEIRLPEPNSIRYNMFFALYQIMHGTKFEDVVIPENLEGCVKEYNQATNAVDIFKDGKQICTMYMTENLVHTSSSPEEAENEIKVFLNLKTNKEKEEGCEQSL